jgi:PAT family beta-lactamase induction signal transducer AmpG
VLAESIGWPAFFIVSTVIALPSLVMLWRLRDSIRALELPVGAPPPDD